MSLYIGIVLSAFVIFLIVYARWQDAVNMSPYSVRPHLRNMVLDGQIYLNPFNWDREILIHEIAHKVRGKGPRDKGYDDPDHDPVFWRTYDRLMDIYDVPRKY